MNLKSALRINLNSNIVNYLIRYGTQEIFTFLEVNGAATDASAIDKEMPGNLNKFNSFKTCLKGLHTRFTRVPLKPIYDQ